MGVSRELWEYMRARDNIGVIWWSVLKIFTRPIAPIIQGTMSLQEFEVCQSSCDGDCEAGYLMIRIPVSAFQLARSEGSDPFCHLFR